MSLHTPPPNQYYKPFVDSYLWIFSGLGRKKGGQLDHSRTFSGSIPRKMARSRPNPWANLASLVA